MISLKELTRPQPACAVARNLTYANGRQCTPCFHPLDNTKHAARLHEQSCRPFQLTPQPGQSGGSSTHSTASSQQQALPWLAAQPHLGSLHVKAGRLGRERRRVRSWRRRRERRRRRRARVPRLRGWHALRVALGGIGRAGATCAGVGDTLSTRVHKP